jgi:carboxymethylenebutenolidase
MGMLQLRAKDGHNLAAYMVSPEGKPRGGVVVIQEVFGLNSHIKRVTEQYAGLGYLAIAPALFDRIKRNVDLPYTDVQAGIDLMMKTTDDGVLADVNAAIDAVGHAGATGMVGYCWGGRVTYLSACRINLAAAVAYYGGGIAQLLDETPQCPIMFHFGERDAYIPASDVEKIRAAVPKGIFHLYPANHGFNCTDRADYDVASARLAFERSSEFFRQHIG